MCFHFGASKRTKIAEKRVSGPLEKERGKRDSNAKSSSAPASLSDVKDGKVRFQSKISYREFPAFVKDLYYHGEEDVFAGVIVRVSRASVDGGKLHPSDGINIPFPSHKASEGTTTRPSAMEQLGVVLREDRRSVEGQLRRLRENAGRTPYNLDPTCNAGKSPREEVLVENVPQNVNVKTSGNRVPKAKLKLKLKKGGGASAGIGSGKKPKG